MSIIQTVIPSKDSIPSTPPKKDRMLLEDPVMLNLWSEFDLKPMSSLSPPKIRSNDCLSPEPSTPKRFNYAAFGGHPLVSLPVYDFKPSRGSQVDIHDMSTNATNCFGQMTAGMTFSTPPCQITSVSRNALSNRDDGENLGCIPRFPTLSF